MDRRVLKYNVAAALFSAAFLFGVSPADAYTYSGITSTIDNITEDEKDLVITNNSKITCNNTIHPNFSKEMLVEIKSKTLDCYHENRYCTVNKDNNVGDLSCYTLQYTENVKNMPMKMSEKMFKEYNQIISMSFDEEKVKYVYDNKKTLENLHNFNIKFSTNIIWNYVVDPNSTDKPGEGDNTVAPISLNNHMLSGWYDTNNKFTGELNFKNEEGFVFLVTWDKYESNNERSATYKDYQNVKVDCSIMVSKDSSLITKGNVQTDKSINVTGNSFLKAAGLITGGDIFSDKAIISTSKDQGESIITPSNITATGALKSDTYIGAWSGAVSGKTVYSGGDVVSANSIKAGGLAKGNVLNVSAINAASASITGNQSISGVFTATGQVKLNGGAALGNKKISSLSAGTLSATSTDAVNGSQLNTIKQKLATAGKTYSAGSDVAITAANAISVAKNGTVDKGNTGIVTGGTVYKITSALNQSLDSLKSSVSSHQSTLTTLSQGLSDLKSSVTNINSSVASATKNLSAQLTNRLQSDMGNLSDDGKNVIRNMVSSTLKSMNSMSIGDGTRSATAIATYEAGNDVEDSGLADIRIGLDSKVTRGDFDQVSTTVASNSKAIDINSSSIQKNTGDIADLKVSKADVDGSNISVDGYAKHLGVGTVEAGNVGLVTGNTVYAALDKKADYGYVAGGLGMVSSQLDAMSQRMTSDLNRVGAGASALAGLHPTGYDASDKLSFAYSGGHYKNVNTSALGAFYHPNEKTMVGLAGTIGNNDAMLSAGISVKVGIGNHVSKVMVTPKMFSAQEVTNQDMKDHLDTQSERIHQIEVALQNR